MKNINETALSLVARITDHFGPLTTAMDSVMDRLTTKQVAKACANYLCYSGCSTACGYDRTWHYAYYASYYILCNYGDYDCGTTTTCGC